MNDKPKYRIDEKVTHVPFDRPATVGGVMREGDGFSYHVVYGEEFGAAYGQWVPEDQLAGDAKTPAGDKK